MVGLVGSSNNPVSGMAIATLLIATMSIKASGKTGIDGMTAAIAIGSVICIVAAIAGDTSQDLKTGYLLGATPKKQQMGEIIGVVVSGLAIGGSSVSSECSLGIRWSRSTCTTGNTDEDDRRGNHGWKPSMEPGIYRSILSNCT